MRSPFWRPLFFLIASLTAFAPLPSGAEPNHSLLEPMGRLLSAMPSEPQGTIDGDSLLEVSSSPTVTTGALLFEGAPPCVLQQLSFVEWSSGDRRLTLRTFDLKRIERIRHAADFDDIDTDFSLEVDDPSVTMILIEGDDWICERQLVLEPSGQDQQRQCDSFHMVNAMEPADRVAANDALDTLRRVCDLP